MREDIAVKYTDSRREGKLKLVIGNCISAGDSIIFACSDNVIS